MKVVNNNLILCLFLINTSLYNNTIICFYLFPQITPCTLPYHYTFKAKDTQSIWPCVRSYATWSREMSQQSHMSKIFNFEFLTPPSDNFKMLHFDANPIKKWIIWLQSYDQFINTKNNIKHTVINIDKCSYWVKTIVSSTVQVEMFTLLFSCFLHENKNTWIYTVHVCIWNKSLNLHKKTTWQICSKLVKCENVHLQKLSLQYVTAKYMLCIYSEPTSLL